MGSADFEQLNHLGPPLDFEVFFSVSSSLDIQSLGKHKVGAFLGSTWQVGSAIGEC